MVKPFLSESTRFSNLTFTNIKVNLVAKIKQSAYYFHVKHKKNTISRGFNLISNSWLRLAKIATKQKL